MEQEQQLFVQKLRDAKAKRGERQVQRKREALAAKVREEAESAVVSASAQQSIAPKVGESLTQLGQLVGSKVVSIKSAVASASISSSASPGAAENDPVAQEEYERFWTVVSDAAAASVGTSTDGVASKDSSTIVDSTQSYREEQLNSALLECGKLHRSLWGRYQACHISMRAAVDKSVAASEEAAKWKEQLAEAQQVGVVLPTILTILHVKLF